MPAQDVIRKREARRSNRSRAREMRHNTVAAEKLFWSKLRDRRLGGFKFRRQYLIGPYIADFARTERKLVVELDGPFHAARTAYDRKRDDFLRSQGYRVMRFRNADLSEADLAKILESLRSPSPQPSPPMGERE